MTGARVGRQAALLRILLITVILATAVGLRAQDLRKPWVGRHNAWGGAMYGNIARNFVRYGYLATRLGPVANSGVVPEARFRFYYHHPPLFVWLLSLSYHVFGVHEWSARLVPLVFSAASMALLYVLARHLFPPTVALLALFFMAAMPVENYYGAHVDVYGSPAVFFSTLAVYGYARWRETGRGHDLILCNLGVVLGCAITWYAHFLVPLLLAHYFLSGRAGSPGGGRWAVWSLPAGAATVFLAFILHRQILIDSPGREMYGTLLEKLALRTSYGQVSWRGVPLAPVELALHHARDVVRLFSAPLVLLAVAWLFLLVRAGPKARLRGPNGFVVLLFGYGILHNVTFPATISGHDFLVASYAPGIALAAAVAFHVGWRWLQDASGPRTAGAVACIALALIGTVGVYMTQRLYAGESRHAYVLRRWGRIVRTSSGPAALVLSPSHEDRILQYYVDREMEFEVDTPQEITDKARDGGRESLFVCSVGEARRFAEVVGYVRARFPERQEAGLLVYRLTDDTGRGG